MNPEVSVRAPPRKKKNLTICKESPSSNKVKSLRRFCKEIHPNHAAIRANLQTKNVAPLRILHPELLLLAPPITTPLLSVNMLINSLSS